MDPKTHCAIQYIIFRLNRHKCTEKNFQRFKLRSYKYLYVDNFVWLAAAFTVHAQKYVGETQLNCAIWQRIWLQWRRILSHRRNISIPSGLISKNDGEAIRNRNIFEANWTENTKLDCPSENGVLKDIYSKNYASCDTKARNQQSFRPDSYNRLMRLNDIQKGPWWLETSTISIRAISDRNSRCRVWFRFKNIPQTAKRKRNLSCSPAQLIKTTLFATCSDKQSTQGTKVIVFASSNFWHKSCPQWEGTKSMT